MVERDTDGASNVEETEMAVGHDRPERTNWTVDEYMELDDDRRYELLRGELLMTPSPNIYHQRCTTTLGTLIESHVLEHDLGECFHAPFDVVLAEETVVQPDFTFVRADRLADLYDGHCISGRPDMVVEVLSKSTKVRDRHRKRRIYAESGISWLLFAEPKARVVEVLHLREDGEYSVATSAVENDTLTFDLFPELELDLSHIWFEPPDHESSGSS